MKRSMNWLGGLAVLALALTMVSCEALSNLAGGATKSSNANLAALDVNPGNLVPTFSPNVTSYTVSGLADTDTQILIDATAADTKASLVGAGGYQLSSGTNKFKVTVSAEDGTTKVYNISATPLATAAVSLSSISVNGTPIAGFNHAVNSYQLDVTTDVTSVTLSATATDATASITGVGVKNLVYGANSFDIVVSKGVQSSSYTVVINRPAPTSGGADVSLSSLKVNGTTIPIVPGSFSYAVTVPANTVLATVVATATASSAVVTNPATQALSPGANVFAVLVANGSTVASYTITITIDTSNIPVSTLVQAGIDALRAQDFSAAKTDFAAALVSSPTDNTAKLWLSLLDLASIQTDPDLVALFKNRIGVTNYPTDLNSYMAGTWFNENYYGSKSGFVLAASDWTNGNYGVYVRGTFTPGTSGSSPWTYYYDATDVANYGYTHELYGYGTFTPNSTGNQYISAWDTSVYGPSIPRYRYSSTITDLTTFNVLPALDKPAMFQQADSAGLQASEYPLILMANVLTKNPTGFNALIDTVVSKMDFSAVEARLDSLSDTERVAIPADLIGYSSANGPEVSLSRNELKLFLASLKVLKGFALYLQSENLDLPLSSFSSSWGTLTYAPQARIDSNSNGIDDKVDAFYASAPGLRTSTFLTSRADGATKRSASRAEFLGAVEDIQSAASGIKTSWEDSSSYYHGWLVFDPTSPNFVAQTDAITNRLQSVLDATAAVLTALNGNTSFYVDLQSAAPTDILGTWIPLPGAASGAGLVEVKPNALWTNNFLDPRAWFQKNVDNTFVTYLRVNGYSWSGSTQPSFTDVPLPASGVALSLADFTSSPNVSSIWLAPSVGLDFGLLNQLLPGSTFGTGVSIPLPGDDYQFYQNSVVVQATVPAGQYEKTDWLNR